MNMKKPATLAALLSLLCLAAPLFAEDGDTDEAKELIEAFKAGDADMDDLNEAFLDAARDGNTVAVRLLLDAGAGLNAWASDALLLAALYGHTDTVKALLDAGAGLNMQDEDGWTALAYAANTGHADTVKALLEAGADANAQADNGATALMAAASRGNTEKLFQ